MCYGSCIEKDPALARRFQAVTVDEPSEAVTLCILRALRPKYEAFHRVRFDDAALQAAVRLAHRSDRQQVISKHDIMQVPCIQIVVIGLGKVSTKSAFSR